MFDTPIRAAMLRAVIGGTFVALTTMVALWLADSSLGFTDRTVILTGLSAFLGVLGSRGAAEGFIDQGSATQRAADKAKAT